MGGVWNIGINTLRPRQNGRHFADDIFKCISLNENVWIPIKIPMKFVSNGPINNTPALVEIMAWRRPGDKPLSEPMIVSLPTHICVTRPQWVNAMSRETDRFCKQILWLQVEQQWTFSNWQSCRSADILRVFGVKYTARLFVVTLGLIIIVT